MHPHTQTLALRLALACLPLLAAPAMATPRFTPTSHNFGHVPIGKSATVFVELDDTTHDNLRSLGVGPDGSYWYTSDYGDFHLDRGNCVQGTTVLAPGVGCTFSITYTPTALGTAATDANATNHNAGTWGFMALTATGTAPLYQSVPAMGPAAVAALTGLVALAAWRRRRTA